MNGKLADTLVLPGDTERLLLNLATDVVEVRIPLVDVEELAPFLQVGGRFRCGCVDELEDEWPTGDDALTAR